MNTRSVVNRVNQETLYRVNNEITLSTHQFANTVLAGIFKAVFHVDKSYEITEPELFQLDHDPDRILWSQLDGHWKKNFAVALSNEEVLSSRFQLFSEYDFVAAIDVSQSMMLDWWPHYGGETKSDDVHRSLPAHRIPGDRTKLFILKYVISSFLRAAKANEFTSFVYLFGGNSVQVYDSKEDLFLEQSILHHIDGHFIQLANRQIVETPQLLDTLRSISTRQRNAVVLLISDFMDLLPRAKEPTPQIPLESIISLLGKISLKNRLVALQVNDILELEPQVEDLQVSSKNCPYLNTESFQTCHRLNLRAKELAAFRERIADWKINLRQGFAELGIVREQLIAGRDDLAIDQKLFRLGLATGS